MHDIIVIGGGAAGLSAAVAAKARNKSVLVIANKIETSQAFKAERIDNYLGIPGVTGANLLKMFSEHTADSGAEIVTGKVSQILNTGNGFCANAGDGIYEAKSLVLALGIKREAQIKGESEFLGRGVSYCATCDGMLYRGKKVVVAGESEEAFSDARFLSEVCEKVLLVTETERGDSAIEQIKGRLIEVRGGRKVSSAVIGTGSVAETVECDGVFIVNNSIPANALIYGLETKDGFIVTDKSMKTNIDGVFAAGDCTGKPFQLAKAVGEGLVAALSAVTFIGRRS